MTDTNEFLNAEEVAAFLRLPRSTVYKLAQDRVIPGFKVGKHWRFRKDTFHEWLKKQENHDEGSEKPKN
jgi:excisionase family DNA binding protein